MKHNDHPSEKSNQTSIKSAPKPSHDEVAKKAYALYEKEGRPPGHAEENWAEAETQMSHRGSLHSDHSGHPGHSEPPDHHDHQAHMAADFRNRFWISLVLTRPILVLSSMLQKLVGLRQTIGIPGDVYVLFGFSSAVFWFGGWPFANGLFAELKTHKPGMIILISVAIADTLDCPIPPFVEMAEN